ncbi:EamA family transporter [Faunimonas sp. B44]|uniref:EamA family transporter n=1 Tax=Faunimonas sp. B44 TaxID=3461493 RepID=UPI004044E707
MTAAVTFAVLVAAFCHASWNAIIRMRSDKVVSMALLVTASGLIALPTLFFFPILPAAAWPFAIASAIIHTGYNTFLALAYVHGELSKAYPLVRGSAPLGTLVLSVLLLDEGVDWGTAVGIVVLAAGIMALALDQGWRALTSSPRGLAYAAATSVCITLYTLSDGLGARQADSAHQYVMWLFALDFPPLLLGTLIFRRRVFLDAAKANWWPSLLGGALSLVAYWIVIWAMTVAPIPIVAALRETSILFAALIGMVVLRERLTPIRFGSILLVLAGLALMRL